MNKNIKILLLLVAVVAVILIGFKYQSNFGSNSETKTKVGVILPLSGQYASIGESAKNAILLSQKDSGNNEVEFIFEDDEYDSKKALSAYRKVRDFDKAEVVIALGAPTIQVIQPLVTKENILTLQLGSEVSHAKDPIFQLMPAGEVVAVRLGEEVSKRYKNVAVVYENATLFALNAQFFNEGAGDKTITTDFKLAPEADYRTEIQKILLTNPDAFTVFLPIENGIKFLKEFRNQTANKKISLICDVNMEITIEQYKEALGSEIFEGCISTALPNTMSLGFVKSYKETYQADPQFTADYAYDAAQIIFDLVKNKDQKDWVKTLESNFKYQGVSGEITFDDLGTRRGIAELHVFRNGSFVPLE